VFFIQGQAKQVPIIPVAALRPARNGGSGGGDGSDGSYLVQLASGDGKDSRIVQTGLINRSAAEVVSGLAVGDEVITGMETRDGSEAAGRPRDGSRRAGGGMRIRF
jgi:hypothetical protein